MEATRVRFGSAIEWVLAASLIFLSLWTGTIVVRELSQVTGATPVIAHEYEPPVPPAAVPPRAVSVPLLLLAGGGAVRVGDTAGQITARFGDDTEVSAETLDRTPLGERLTRTYQHGNVRFILVFEAVERGAERRVAAIYLQ